MAKFLPQTNFRRKTQRNRINMKTGLILGFFDGVHIGHQAVINSAIEYAEKAVLITFKNSPAEYFSGNYEYIYPRQKSISRMHNVEVIELDFSKIAAMPAEEYLEFLINEYHPVSISTGFNHTFGRNKSGDTKLLEACQEKYDYKYFCTPPHTFEGEPISSSRIKSLLKSGEIEKANAMLGSPFSLEGKVIHGAQLGRSIGFPTANIKYPEHIVKLPFGVYGGKAGCHQAVINWGVKPTVNNVSEPAAEIHILGFEGDLYGQNIEIEILKKLRDEKKFESLDDLKEQIKKDVEACSEL